MASRKPSSDSADGGPTSPRIAALCTRHVKDAPFCASTARMPSAAAARSSGFAISATWISIAGGESSTAPAAAKDKVRVPSSASLRRPNPMTRRPLARRTKHRARPMPEPAPVTTATSELALPALEIPPEDLDTVEGRPRTGRRPNATLEPNAPKLLESSLHGANAGKAPTMALDGETRAQAGNEQHNAMLHASLGLRKPPE
mmetsp:Transcript_11599/g.31452  ORF Transcript_11599/g.31452 Transcript_11599/m.31452 type:complete len:202 (-) Transcript_11599:4-609(-)